MIISYGGRNFVSANGRADINSDLTLAGPPESFRMQSRIRELTNHGVRDITFAGRGMDPPILGGQDYGSVEFCALIRTELSKASPCS